MKTVKKNVYYCDFCKKRTLSASSMKVHESHCTANPDRKCRMCDNYSGVGEYVMELKGRFKIIKATVPEPPGSFYDDIEVDKAEWIGKPITLSEIESIADYCPNCMLAIIRQAGLNQHPFTDEKGDNPFHFDYKARFSQAMRDKKEDMLRNEYNYS